MHGHANNMLKLLTHHAGAGTTWKTKWLQVDVEQMVEKWHSCKKGRFLMLAAMDSNSLSVRAK